MCSLRNDVRVRRARPVLLDRSAPGLVAIVENLLAELRGVVQRRQRRGDHVVHGVAKPPFALRPGAQVHRRRAQLAITRREAINGCRAGRRTIAALCFRPPRRNVLVHRHVVDVARIPRVEGRELMGGARLAVGIELFGNASTDRIHLARHDRGDAETDGIGEWRNPDPRRKGGRLVVHVDDVRLPVSPRALNHS